jgi:hypothetical protein
MDLESRARWVAYSKAKDRMFAATDTSESPWWVVDADDKKRARLNCIQHLLDSVKYKDLSSSDLALPEREDVPYERPAMDEQRFVVDHYAKPAS